MAPPKIQILRTLTPNQAPATLAPGELAIEMASLPPRLWVGVPASVDATGMKMLLPSGGVVVSETPIQGPKQGDLWYESDTGILWMWYDDGTSQQWVQVNGVGASGSSVTVADTAPATPAAGDLWWESDTGTLWIWYVDANSSQWVQAAGASGGGGTPVDAYTKTESDAKYVELAGDTMIGGLTLAYASPTLTLDNPDAAGFNLIAGSRNGVLRWRLVLVGNDPEVSGSNAGSNLSVQGFNDAGTLVGEPFRINRLNGSVDLRYYGGGLPVSPGRLNIKYNTGEYGIAIAPLTDGGAAAIFENATSNIVGSISTTVAATAFNTSSDDRLKEDAQPFDAGPIIDATDVYDFAWVESGERAHGVIAQEAAEVYPEAVFHDEAKDWWGVDYSKYVPLLLQELKALRARVAALEGAP
jgi:hypothetical protein